jgi:hypothetical protein
MHRYRVEKVCTGEVEEVLRSGAPTNQQALNVRCRQLLAGYKVTKAEGVFVPAVQRSPSGKVDYRRARMTAEQRLAPD